MNYRVFKKLVLILALTIGMLATGLPESRAAEQRVRHQSSVPTKGTSRTQPRWSASAQKALEYVSAKEKIGIQRLAVVNEFSHNAALLNKSFQTVTISDQKSGRVFKLFVDKETNLVQDRSAIEVAENQSRTGKYGKLQPTLYEKLQQLRNSDSVTVTIVLSSAPGQGISDSEAKARAKLAAKYPEARDAIDHNKTPMDVQDRNLAKKIYKEYIKSLRDDVPERIGSLLAELKRQKLTPVTVAGVPAITVRLTKNSINLLAQRADVGTIFLESTMEIRAAVGGAVEANKAPYVWQQGYTGSNTSIAIVEPARVDFTSAFNECPPGTNNCFAHPGMERNSWGSVGYHATGVASAAASTHATFKGMAPDATIISANFQNTIGAAVQTDIASAVGWALNDADADVVNTSQAVCSTSTAMTDLDW